MQVGKNGYAIHKAYYFDIIGILRESILYQFQVVGIVVGVKNNIRYSMFRHKGLRFLRSIYYGFQIDRIQAPMVMPDEMRMPDYAREDAKLAAGYAKTDTWLVKREKASLEIAAKRLMENPELAKQLVEGGV